MEDEILDTKGICLELKCARVKLARLIKNEGLPAALIGGEYRALKNDLFAWIAERAREDVKRRRGDV